MKISSNAPCPCGSGIKYKRCCRPLHLGQPAATPEALMRSRYVAYALGLVDHILATTDPRGPRWEADEGAWRASVAAFTRETSFDGLDVLGSSFGPEPDRGEVHFRVRLTRGDRPAGFSERSLFLRRDGRWLYHSGR
jgi:SEC-C motif domain protein